MARNRESLWLSNGKDVFRERFEAFEKWLEGLGREGKGHGPERGGGSGRVGAWEASTTTPDSRATAATTR